MEVAGRICSSTNTAMYTAAMMATVIHVAASALRRSGASVFCMVRASLDLVGRLLAEQAGGLDDEDDDQEREGKCVGEGTQPQHLRGQARLQEDDVQALDDAFADADDERAHHRAGHRADAAEHRRHKGLEAGMAPEVWMTVL